MNKKHISGFHKSTSVCLYFLLPSLLSFLYPPTPSKNSNYVPTMCQVLGAKIWEDIARVRIKVKVSAIKYPTLHRENRKYNIVMRFMLAGEINKVLWKYGNRAFDSLFHEAMPPKQNLD